VVSPRADHEKHKVITVHGQQVKVYSLDGRTWFSRPTDFAQFKKRSGVVVASSRRLMAKLPDYDSAAVNVSAKRPDEVRSGKAAAVRSLPSASRDIAASR